MQDISRAAAAINILDDYLKGYPLEKVLKQWFKKNRFAGSNAVSYTHLRAHET